MNKDITKELKSLDHLIKENLNKGKNPPKRGSFTHFQILRYLLKNQDNKVYQKDLCEELKMKKSSITECLDSMELEGYIARIPDIADKRRNQIVLTEKSLHIKIEIDSDLKRVNEQLLKGVDEERLNQFFETLEMMKRNIEGK